MKIGIKGGQLLLMKSKEIPRSQAYLEVYKSNGELFQPLINWKKSLVTWHIGNTAVTECVKGAG